MPYFSLEGCVCAGKSTVLKFIVAFLRKERRLCDVVPESFSHFTDYQDRAYNPLTEMQRDAMRNIFPGQLHILNKSVDYYYSHVERDSNVTVVSDRSVFSCYSFIDCYFSEGYHSHFSKDYLNDLWQDECDKVRKPDCFIFLDVPSPLCWKHLMDEGRRTFLNRNTWTEKFLTVLCSLHEKMFSQGENCSDRGHDSGRCGYGCAKNYSQEEIELKELP